MQSSFNTLINHLIPPRLKEKESEFRMAKILILFILLMWLVLLLSMLSTFVLNIETEIPFSITIIALLFISLVFYKTASLKIGGNITAAFLFLIVGGISVKSGGLYSMDLIFCITASIIAFLTAGKRSGLVWTIIIILTYFIYYILETQYGISFIDGNKVGDSDYFLIVGVLTTTAICGAVWIYENEKGRNIQALEATKKELSSLNASLENKVIERTASLKKANLNLLRSNKDLEQFAYVASHDLQEPLRMVGNFVQLLEEEYNEKVDDTGKVYIKFAVDGVSRMSVLIEELLQFSRVGHMGQSLKKHDINTIIKDKLSDLSMIIKSKNAKVEFSKMPSIRCIGGQIGIVFYNLINNALKFNDKEIPLIKISYEENSSHWVFKVSDNGIGMAEGYKEQIFEIFKRLHSKTEYSGTGIGLAVCKKIIHQHHGEISVDSELGKGTSFHFSIAKELELD